MTALVDNLVPDELWVLVEPLLPAPPRIARRRVESSVRLGGTGGGSSGRCRG